MAHPKRKTSKTAKRTRRAAWNSKIQLATTVECTNCSEAREPHKACPSCGQYNGRLIVNVENA
jgi:large subunit ribosomal protein L32